MLNLSHSNLVSAPLEYLADSIHRGNSIQNKQVLPNASAINKTSFLYKKKTSPNTAAPG
jgi:hypothetical protein